MSSLMSSRLNINSDLIMMLDSSMPQMKEQGGQWVSSGLAIDMPEDLLRTGENNVMGSDLLEYIQIQDNFVQGLHTQLEK